MQETANNGPKQRSGTSNDISPLEAAIATAFAQSEAWAGREDKRLARDPKTDRLLNSFDNVLKVLRMDGDWQGVLGYDEFSGMVCKRKLPPFELAQLGEWLEFDDSQMRVWFAERYGLRPKKDDLIEAVITAAKFSAFHVVREWLESLTWDKVPRQDYWLMAYMGAEQTEYTVEVGRRWLLAAVARIYQPGCQADYVLILEGEQELGKSSALRIMFDPWFTDAPFRIGEKDGYQIIRGKWGVELAELDGFNRAESSAAKLFFSQRVDRYRTPWDKRPADVPRQQIFAGTVNPAVYLRDDTGNRRYWPVLCTRADLDELRADREQLFAEAVVRYKAGERWEPRREQQAMFREQQEKRYMVDAWEERIRQWLNEPERRDKAEFQTVEILGNALGLETSKMTRAEQMRVGHIMQRLGWVRERSSAEGRPWVYKRRATVQ